MSSVELRMSQPENPGEEQVASESPTCAQLISDPREARVQVRASVLGRQPLHAGRRGTTAAIDSSFNDYASSLARSQLTGLLSALFSRITAPRRASTVSTFCSNRKLYLECMANETERLRCAIEHACITPNPLDFNPVVQYQSPSPV